MRNRHAKLVLLALGLSFLLPLVGCTAATKAPTSPSEIRFLASFYPAYLATQRIAQGVDGIRVEMMAGPQAGLMERYLLSEPDFEAIRKCGAFFGMGGGLESFWNGAIGAEVCPMVALGEGIARLPGEEGADNPYVWLAPGRWMQILSGAAAALETLDEPHRQAYADQLAQALASVSVCRMQLSQANLTGQQAVILHPAATYLAEEAGLTIALTITRDPAYQPGAGDLADLRDLVKDHPGALALLENTAPTALIDTLREAGLRPVLLETLCAGMPGDAVGVWEAAFEQNLRALTGA